MNCGPISFWSVGKVRRAKAWVRVGRIYVTGIYGYGGLRKQKKRNHMSETFKKTREKQTGKRKRIY